LLLSNVVSVNLSAQKKPNIIKRQVIYLTWGLGEVFSSQEGMTRRKQNNSMIFNANDLIEGHMLEQLVEALCYKPEGHGFDPR
jgi:hypothetical protein